MYRPQERVSGLIQAHRGLSLLWQSPRGAVPAGSPVLSSPCDPQHSTGPTDCSGDSLRDKEQPLGDLGLGKVTVTLSGFIWEPLSLNIITLTAKTPGDRQRVVTFPLSS